MYYFGARYYDPRTSVWQSTDQILGDYLDGQTGRGGVYNSLNLGLYAYTHLNPVRYNDPDGNVPVDTVWDAISIVYDLGKASYGYVTSNPVLVTEGLTDAAADTAALFIPYVPAGSTKLARMGGEAVEQTSKTAKRAENAVDTTKKGMPDDAIVCRGGSCTADRFANGSGVTSDAAGKLDGVSVNSVPGKSLQELTEGIPHNKVGVTTVGDVRKAGGNVIASPTRNNPNHATMSGVTAKQAEKLMTPTVRNPNK